MIFDEYPQLENDRLLLKKMTMRDLPELEEMAGQEEVYRYEPTFLPELLSTGCRDFIASDCDRLFQRKEGILLGIYAKEEPDRFIGIAEFYGYSPERDKISIGYRLKTECWGKGIGSSVVSLMKDYIVNDVKMQRITAHVRIENPASGKCLLRNGFIQRRGVHEEDWGFPDKVLARKYVIYPETDWPAPC